MIFKKIVSYSLIVMSMLGLVGLGAVSVSADAIATTRGEVTRGVTDVGGGDTGNSSSDLTKTIKNVINILLFLIGMVAVIFIVIAGLRFVTSNGDANTVSSAKNTIIYAVIGIVVAVMAYAIVNFILFNIA
ncbi:MAG: hypothetical protein AAB395_00595 [Patescibacteria group bacterium]